MQPTRERETATTKPLHPAVRATKKQTPKFIAPQEFTPTVSEIKKVLGSLTILRFKTQIFHWNVEGPSFKSLHVLFEEQYNTLDEQIDLFAERMRALGFYAPMSLRELTIESYIDDVLESSLNWKFMVETLIEDHQRMGKISNEAARLASEEGDSATASMFDDLTVFHQKASWMLSAYLK